VPEIGPDPDARDRSHDTVLARYLRPGTLNLGAPPPLSLYVHLPWCLHKCPYCDFNSHELAPGTHATSPLRSADSGFGRSGARERTGTLPEERYVQALLRDLEAALPLVWGRRVHSIFIGGGTPSLFSPEAVDRLLCGIRARMPLEPGCETTLEANPGTFERDRFRGFRCAGVNRISIGVQSFDDAKLRALGRVHDGAQARAAIEEARDTFETFNLDLMYALPGQTLDELDADLRCALSYRPPHLSIYHLTIEPNTLFAKRPPELPDHDAAADMLDRITALTTGNGLERYEVSAFAQPGHRCAHNLNYWRFGDYLGIGAGAHSKLSFPHRIQRQVRLRDPARYMAQALAGNAVALDNEVARTELPFEFMLNALRLKQGFDLVSFQERTGLASATVETGLAEAERRGLVIRDLRGARPSQRGFDFLNDLQAIFLPE
jgi:putative oxygen-independent coproporphyrinogen III oxidase